MATTRLSRILVPSDDLAELKIGINEVRAELEHLRMEIEAAESITKPMHDIADRIDRINDLAALFGDKLDAFLALATNVEG